jgi:oxalate decarboxylase
VRERPAFIFATVMTLTAGFVDAIGYTHIGKLYLSFMSGNTTRFGIAVSEWDTATILLAGAVIALFVVGAGIGALLTDAPAPRPMARVLGVEVALFALALALVLAVGSEAALLPVAVAMGMQNSVHQVVLKADIGKSFVTGALFGLGQSLARALRDRARSAEWLVYAASWLSFVGGVVLGSVVLMQASLALALGIATAVLAALALLAVWENE